MKEDIMEVKKELEKIKQEEQNETVATEVLKLMKRSLMRMYGLLIIFIILFVFSIFDSIYQRCRIIDILEQYEVVEETETYEVVQDGGDNSNNNFISGDNNEVYNGSED